jgi:hypothetical protein
VREEEDVTFESPDTEWTTSERKLGPHLMAALGQQGSAAGRTRDRNRSGFIRAFGESVERMRRNLRRISLTTRTKLSIALKALWRCACLMLRA